MANNFIKRYTWLVEYLLVYDGASFDQIAEAWSIEDSLNPSHKPMSRSTFNKHLTAIPRVLNISIVHSEDHKYRVDNYHGQLDNLLYSNVSLSAWLDKDKKLSGRIIFEAEPACNFKWLEDIAQAMSECKKIELEYKKYGDGLTTLRTLSPYCLKMYKRRWYLLAGDGGMEKTFALDDRLRCVRILKEPFALPKGFDAASRFRDAYGITMVGAPQTVKIKTFGPETAYWRSVPIHQSQQEIETEEGYSVFSFCLCPQAPEFIHALLSHGATIEVLEPASLRDTLIAKIDEMKERYS